MRKPGVFLLVILGSLVGASFQPLPPSVRPLEPLIVQIDSADPKQILRWNVGTGATRPLPFRSANTRIDEIAVSPDNAFITVIETLEGVVREGEYQTPPRNRLVILDSAGRTVRRLEQDVRYLTFSPDGKSVAFIVGSYYEGGVGFKPTGAFILDIATGRQQSIEGVRWPYELHWLQAGGEDAVYVKVLERESPILPVRYDVARSRAEPTDSPAFHFSPDGQYYLLEPHETIDANLCEPGTQGDSCLRVFERRGGKALQEFSSARYGMAVGWAYNQGHLLMFTQQERVKEMGRTTRGARTIEGTMAGAVRKSENFIYDVGTGQLVERFEGIVIGKVSRDWISGIGTLVVRPIPDQPVGQPPSRRLLLRRPLMSPQVAVPSTSALLPRFGVHLTMEPDTVQSGADYRSIDLSEPRPELCEQECFRDAKCAAYTYTRPSGQGRARCGLKAEASTARPNECCVSGVKIRGGADPG